MIIYNPTDENILRKRMLEAQSLLNQIPTKYCFISGSFLYKENFKDIDIFILSRTKKELKLKDKRVKITILDFNQLYSLFYHSVSKSCLAKNILPRKLLKVTISEYWHIINEAIPTLLNEKDKFHKNVRSLVLYTEYFQSGEILDTFQLTNKINSFKNYKEIVEYIKSQIPIVINRKVKPSYAKRFFYTQAAYYKGLREYAAQNLLYNLSHEITKQIVYGQSNHI